MNALGNESISRENEIHYTHHVFANPPQSIRGIMYPYPFRLDP